MLLTLTITAQKLVLSFYPKINFRADLVHNYVQEKKGKSKSLPKNLSDLTLATLSVLWADEWMTDEVGGWQLSNVQTNSL